MDMELVLRRLAWTLGFSIALAISLIDPWTCWPFGSTWGGVTGVLPVDG